MASHDASLSHSMTTMQPLSSDPKVKHTATAEKSTFTEMCQRACSPSKTWQNQRSPQPPAQQSPDESVKK